MPVTRSVSKPNVQALSNSLAKKKPVVVNAKQKSNVKKAPKAVPTDLPIRAFETAAAFEEFLEHNHLISPGLHLKLARKASGIPSITGKELVEVALCFGWIDGQGNGFDENYYLARCTPRRNKSLWSQKNVNTVNHLLDDGRMRPAGIAAVDAAQADGRWARAYAGPKNITVQKDLQDALDANEAAHVFFKSLNSAERYAVLWRIDTASPTARAGRISALVEGLATGRVPGRPEKEQKNLGVNTSGATKTSGISKSRSKR